jgi:cardiolipin synthase A/B
MAMSRLALLAADSPKVVSDLLALLETGAVGLGASRAVLDSKLRGSDKVIAQVHEIVSGWPRPEGVTDPAGLAAALRAVLDVRRLTIERAPACEVVWTGKGATGPVRATVPVVLEMVAGATRDILLLSYAVWLRQSRANSVLDRLADLSSRGVDVTWIVDARYLDGHNHAEIVENWPVGRRRPRVFGWRDVDDEIAKLHAKVLIVDQWDALVTSANLTGHGLTSNVELGFRVQGNPAADLSGHLRHLITTGVFEPLGWAV